MLELSAAWLAGGCGARAARPRGHVFELRRPGSIIEERFELAPGQAVRFEVRGESAGAVAVLHLWDERAKREVARGGSSWFERAQLEYKNAGAEARGYALVLRAASAQGSGSVDLVRDGRLLRRGARIAGAMLEVASGVGYVYQVASAPAGPTAATLYAFDPDGRLLGFDARSGPLGLPRLLGPANVHAVMVAASATGRNAGALRVYVNDPKNDHDGDGLGRALERALGTCDGPDEPGCKHSSLAGYYHALPHATRDSDRDGVEDGEELLGVGMPRWLDLPRFGADPRHKDVFVEVDREARVEGAGLSEEDIVAIAQLFARGGAAELRNPDQQPGVRLHLDVGFTPSTPGDAGLFGAFGGSNTVATTSYKTARRSDFGLSRQGYFRYALLTRAGTGQATGDAFTVNRDFHRVPIFAHELAHTLGLAHHGHDRWGRANCKPNYLSIMNYLYQNHAEVGFSQGVARVLNPARVLESERVDARAQAAFSASPLELDIIDGAVDWNRDGVISREPVRAGLQWATYKSCGAAERGLDVLATGPLAHATPALVAAGGRLHALWLDATGTPSWRAGRISGPDADGSCPLGDATSARCMTWSEPQALPGLVGLRELSVARIPERDTEVAFAYVDAAFFVHAGVLELGGARAHVRVDHVISGARSEHGLALAWGRVSEARYGVERALFLLWRDPREGKLMRALARSPAGPFLSAPALDADVQPIVSALAPALSELGTGELCGVFPDRDAYLRFYCYEPSRDVFVDLSRAAFYAGLGPHSAGGVGLAYHRYRAADGTPADAADATRGALYLTFTEPESQDAPDPDNPHFMISAALSATRGAHDAIDFRWRGSVINQWTKLAHGTAVTLYEDESLSALKALMLTDMKKTGTRVEFLPLADGAYDEDFGSGNDFEVMERGICLGLHGPDRCGDATTAAY